MSREWQQTRVRECVMPDAVYYQSIWAVRDLARMETRIRELRTDGSDGPGRSVSLVCDDARDYQSIRPTEREALERVLLEQRVSAIRTALNGVPEMYRNFILDNVVYHKKESGYNSKIWKIWKQRFLFHVAKNLSLM